ncbi:hypothetical protein ACFT7S_35550 [Streptomyces sp. NPDC057136]|uniref:hypothetical protein n=1 Tax=Streptomyces sp. NPDC057136 TaxID=3346029 RepID=UPI00363534E4
MSRGYFSHLLLDALRHPGPAAATYGTVHTRVEEGVRSRIRDQHPELRGPDDQRFLHGESAPPSPYPPRRSCSGTPPRAGR